MSINQEQRRQMDKLRAIQESKMTAAKISTMLFILFGIFVVNIIISFSKSDSSSPQTLLGSSWVSVLSGLAIGIITLLIPDYDGACRRAGGCYLAAMGLPLLLFISPSLNSTIVLLYVILIAEVILMIIYYLSICFEMRDRLSSLSEGAGVMWKIVAVALAISYIILLFIFLFAMTADDFSRTSAEFFVKVLKFDAYAIIISNVGFIIMLPVTAIMLRQYADSPTMAPGMPPYPAAGMQTPYGGYPAQTPYGQPYAPQGQPYPQPGVPQPYAQPGMPQPGMPQPGVPQPYAQPGMPQPYTQPYAQPYAAPAIYHNLNTSRAPSANEWVCSCGRINPNYTGTCACGQKKNSSSRRPASNAAKASEDLKAQPRQAGVPSNEADKIKLLKEYKQLLDSGIITQEDFEAKKKDLL